MKRKFSLNLFLKGVFFLYITFFVVVEIPAQSAQLKEKGKDLENDSGKKHTGKSLGDRFASIFVSPPRSKWDNKIKPGASFKWGNGYRFSIGPKVTWKKYLGKENALRASISYLPLMFKDIGADNKIGFTNIDISYIKYPTSRFFYTIGYDYSMFKANDQIKSFVQKRGGNISDDALNGFSLIIGQRVMKIPFSLKGLKITIPIYLRCTYRWGENYEFGNNFGDAGSNYNQSKGFSVTLWPMIRRF